MMKKRKKGRRIVSLLLGGMLFMATPLQAIADDVPPPENPVEETAVEEPVEATQAPVQEEAPVVESTPVAVEPQAEAVASEDPVPVATPQPAETQAPVVPAETAEPVKAEPVVAEEPAYSGTQTLNGTTGKGIQVNVSFEAGTFGEEALPELRVKDIAEKEAVASAQKALGDQAITEAMSVDISFFVDGTEVQPQNGKDVSVKIDLPESLNPEGKNGEYNLIHEHDGKAEVVNTAEVSANEATFLTDSFSTFTITWTSDNQPRARLTVHYVDENRKELSKNQNSVSVGNSSGTISLSQYSLNNINNYRYNGAYILDNGNRKDITDISYQRSSAGRYYTYTVRYLNNGTEVKQDTTNIRDGTILRDVYMEYHSIFVGDHDASVFFLLTPTSNADSNDTTHWNSNQIAVGLGDATVNLEDAVFASDNKNVFKNRNGNGDLHQYIKSWPDGSAGATWTITSENTGSQWDAITSDVAQQYQAQLQKQLGTTATISKNDIESITVTPYKISVNNGNVTVTGGSTETIHIDSTISVVCKRAYHYAFYVDYPSGSGYTSGSVKDGDKAIHVSENQSTPDSITDNDLPESKKVPQTITGKNGIRYTFDGWYREADYTNNVSFAYQPTMDEIRAGGGTVSFYARYRQATRNISVSKTWDDNDNQDGKRPDSITVKLLANGKENGQTLILAAGEDWNGSFENLPIYDESGNEIIYTVKEEKVSGYTAADPAGDAETGFVITNTHTPETITINGTKTWNDADNNDGKRPDNVTVRLYANGVALTDQVKTVTGEKKDSTWNFAFTDLPKYKDGEEIRYTITEDQVENYTTTVNNADYNITNSYNTSKVSVEVTKNWEDNYNQDGIRPNSVTVKLLADGVATNRAETMNAGTEWTAVFDNLDEYKDGNKITYTVEETEVPGYTSEVTGNAKTGFVITNSHTPETMNIQGTKIWDDNHNQDGKRPESITVRLRANGVEVQSLPVTGKDSDTWSYEFHDLPKFADGEEITYAVTEDAVDNYSTEVDGFQIRNSYTPEKTSVSVTKNWDDNDNQDGKRPGKVTVQLYQNGDKTGKTVELNETNSWSHTFTDLDLYQDGRKIKYTVKEETEADGYESVTSGNAEEGYTITNVHTPETTDIKGTKNWKNATKLAEDRPESVTVRLYANGDPVENQVQTVTGDADKDTWNYEFNDLPKYENGKEIVYTVTEDHVEGYTTAIDQKNYSITNTYDPDLTSITVTKNWEDSDNQDNIRPGSVTVTLFADGEKTEQTKTLSAENEWTDTFDDLLEKKDGKKIRYTVEETPVKGYTTEISGDENTGYVITNAYTPERISISGTKVWDDNENQDGKRPESITVRLLNTDNEEVDSVTVNQDSDWKWEFRNVAKYNNGNPISYTVKEDPVEGYTPEPAGSVSDGFTITNHYTPSVKSIPVTKHWDDSNNKDGIRPEKITIVLLANGDRTDQRLVLNKENHWLGTFENLPVYQNGQKIIYTVFEETTEGYVAKISGDEEKGFDVTNIHKVKTTDETPADPENPSGSDQPKGPGQILKTLSPKTGDAGLNGYWMMFLAGLAVVAVVLIRQNIDRKNS